jgi:hypothetical protein
MKKIVGKSLKIALIIILSGVLFLGVVLVAAVLNPVDPHFEEKLFADFDGEIDGLDVATRTRNIVVTGTDGDFSVGYHDGGNGKLVVSFSDGRLTVREELKKSLFDWSGFRRR